MRNNSTIKIPPEDFPGVPFNDFMQSVGTVMTIRFSTIHSVQEIHRGFREILSNYQKLRTIIEPTFLSYCYRIIDDDSTLDILFQEAFQTVPDIVHGTDAFFDYRNNLLNESFALGSGLPFKVRIIGNSPQPIILLSLHHMIGDGASLIQIVISLLRYLKGEKLTPVPITGPSIIGAIIRKPLKLVPRQIIDALKDYSTISKMTKGIQIMPIKEKSFGLFSPSAMIEHYLTHPVSEIKAKCKTLNCTINVFLLTALTDALRNQFYKDKGNAIGISLSTDLRPFLGDSRFIFGNYSSSVMIACHKKYWYNPIERMQNIRDQLEQHLRALTDKSRSWNLLLTFIPNLLGRKMYTKGAMTLKRKGALNLYCQFSNISSLDKINDINPQAQVIECLGMVNFPGLLIVLCSLNDKMLFYFTFPKSDFTDSEITSLIKHFEKGIDDLLCLKRI